MNRRRVLIETSWNVKDGIDGPCLGKMRVLIETSWNVKSGDVYTIDRDCSINRNIVECKGYTIVNISYLQNGINRNIVECKGS